MGKQTCKRVTLLQVIALTLTTFGTALADSRTDELARRSEVIVIGDVTSISSHWNADKSLILSDVVVVVSESIKSAAALGSVTVTVLGGEVGEVGLHVSHQPLFQVGEKVLLFATLNTQGKLQVVSGDEGKLTIDGEVIRETGEYLQNLKSSIQK